jgi:hypothetical protein
MDKLAECSAALSMTLTPAGSPCNSVLAGPAVVLMLHTYIRRFLLVYPVIRASKHKQSGVLCAFQALSRSPAGIAPEDPPYRGRHTWQRAASRARQRRWGTQEIDTANVPLVLQLLGALAVCDLESIRSC